ncbi:CAP domain-containing protein [Streptomyces sp. ISL-66]|uniref:CAP domain-containing protein n=1 Tax=Streptomyces sp. ISL-66 TaxID=2819186 RepID=UPI001BEC5B47|nr:CAP domain-containing protein [Streptomyces sp. ISL-66]MBT2468386.1 CAP domain-containing protein [Streptomyces sp. ISL-66]
MPVRGRGGSSHENPHATRTAVVSFAAAVALSVPLVPAAGAPIAAAPARARLGLSQLPFNSELTAAARSHLDASLAQKWWGNGRNPHQNPQVSGSANDQIGRRIRGAGYCANGGSWNGYEIVYNGWGGASTPKAAVNWWLNISTQGHAEIIRNASVTDIGAASRGGAADRAGANQSQAGTYVVTFGRCG